MTVTSRHDARLHPSLGGVAQEGVLHVRKQDLVREVAEATGQNDTASTKAVNAVFAAITAALADGDEVTISGFGSFKVVERSARPGRNPLTGEHESGWRNRGTGRHGDSHSSVVEVDGD